MRLMLALCASLLLGACAATTDQGGATEPEAAFAPPNYTRLPFDPFGAGAIGDWSMYSARRCAFEGDRFVSAAKGVVLFERVAPDGDDIGFRVRDDWRALDASTAFLVDEFDRRSRGVNTFLRPSGVPPALDDYLAGLLREPLFSDALWSVVDSRQETYTTAQTKEFADKGPGHAFGCTRFAFDLAQGSKTAHVILWVSSEVRGTGLVGIRIHHLTGPDERGVELLDLELFGHGTADETLFGTPKELVFTDE